MPNNIVVFFVHLSFISLYLKLIITLFSYRHNYFSLKFFSKISFYYKIRVKSHSSTTFNSPICRYNFASSQLWSFYSCLRLPENISRSSCRNPRASPWNSAYGLEVSSSTTLSDSNTLHIRWQARYCLLSFNCFKSYSRIKR